MGGQREDGLAPSGTGWDDYPGAQTWAEHRRAHPGVCGHGRHDPSAPLLTKDSTRFRARAIVRCRRCGAYIASFEGPLRAVQSQLSAPRS